METNVAKPAKIVEEIKMYDETEKDYCDHQNSDNKFFNQKSLN